MILVDTGPLVALFDPRDPDHHAAVNTLKAVSDYEPLMTTVPVLTEAFHLLGPSSRGANALGRFIAEGGAQCWYFSDSTLERAFELMDRYRDHPMDLADASLVTAAEVRRTNGVMTLDRRDFDTYRIRVGRGHKAFRVIDARVR